MEPMGVLSHLSDLFPYLLDMAYRLQKKRELLVAIVKKFEKLGMAFLWGSYGVYGGLVAVQAVCSAYSIRPTGLKTPRVAWCNIEKVDLLWGFHGISMGSMTFS